MVDYLDCIVAFVVLNDLVLFTLQHSITSLKRQTYISVYTFMRVSFGKFNDYLDEMIQKDCHRHLQKNLRKHIITTLVLNMPDQKSFNLNRRRRLYVPNLRRK
jgi:hypothetical protein